MDTKISLIDWNQAELVLEEKPSGNISAETAEIYRYFLPEAKRHFQEMREFLFKNPVYVARKARQMKGIAFLFGMVGLVHSLTRLYSLEEFSPAQRQFELERTIDFFHFTIQELTQRYPQLQEIENHAKCNEEEMNLHGSAF